MSTTGPVPAPLPLRTPTTSAAGQAALFALAALVLGLVGIVGLLVAPGRGEVAAVATTVLLAGVAPTLTSLSLVVLARDVGLVTPRGALQVAVAAASAWALATLTSLSWAVGFEQADAGLAPTGFASAFLPLLGAAVCAGAVAWVPVVAGALRSVRPAAVRRAVVVLCSVVGAVAVGAATYVPGTVVSVTTVLVVACGRWWLRGRDAVPADGRDAGRPHHGGAVPEVAASHPVAAEVPHRRLVVTLAAAGGALSLPPALYALLGDQDGGGPTWLPGVLADLPPMNLGLALGALTSLPLVVAAGLAAARWWGRRALVMAALVAVAVVLRGAGAATGPSGETGTLLLFAGALLAGCAGVLPLVARVPGPAAARWALGAVVAGALAWVVGLPLLAVLPLAAPLLAVALVVVVTRRPRRGAVAVAPA